MSDDPLVARCPAKVNLALRVRRRLSDGFHELDTIFQAIDLWDRLELWPDSGLSLRCDAPEVPSDDSNLVLRAARLLRDTHPSPSRGGRFRLTKRIPVQAGLGGGSSNAAAALLLCCRLWKIRLSAERLCSLAAKLGADVPFFLVGGTARGRGRGDLIEPLPDLPKVRFLLGTPPFGVSTPEVFRGISGRLTLPGIGVNLPFVSGHKWPPENNFEFAHNDLESVAFDLWPELERFRDAMLEMGGRPALLSGSGSTVYGFFGESEQLEEARSRLQVQFGTWRLVATRPVSGGVRLDP